MRKLWLDMQFLGDAGINFANLAPSFCFLTFKFLMSRTPFKLLLRPNLQNDCVRIGNNQQPFGVQETIASQSFEATIPKQ